MSIVFVLVCVAIAIGILIYIGMWTVYLDMVTDHCDTYAWGTFAQFEREYAKRQWEQQADFPQSHFSVWMNLHHNSEIHADIIKFDDVGMLLNPMDFLLFKLWEKNHMYKKPSGERPGHWEKE